MQKNFYKENKNDLIWWIDNPDVIGEWLFSFDKKEDFQFVFRLSVEADQGTKRNLRPRKSILDGFF
ncbi:hypothetical protein [uncultured Anaerovibrio sp.]|uniref:DUF7675 family protein n=1 Tax=uncultured Anaerovibrio sp. TaxID=361586 RepID=UPI002635E866|nr:hypothetical protein [uncultured Anaerovibrio sp.]